MSIFLFIRAHFDNYPNPILHFMSSRVDLPVILSITQAKQFSLANKLFRYAEPSWCNFHIFFI